ncbi:hypothetical protein, partial [Pantoea agglomerans]|uniref:hypothetical protein n=1 Tax=Enterobacter agglomerans TaxID=549 RepID=UPI003C7D2257
FRRIVSEGYRHKKARRAYAMRAFRTSADGTGTIFEEFWWSWRSLNKSRKLMKLSFFCQFNFDACT